MLFFKKKTVTPSLLRTSDSTALREAYNRIRTNLAARLAGVEHPIVGVASPAAGEGSAACAENLALAFARLGRRVLLVDADFRAETAPAVFSSAVGLAELIGGESVAPVLTEAPLFVLSRGTTEENPADLLGSDAFAQKLQELAAAYDMVFVSLPAVNGYADALAAAPALTGTVVSLALNATDRRDATRAIASLHDVGATLIGTVTVG